MTREVRRWRRSALVWPERAFTLAEDDWTLVDEAGVRLARIFRLGTDDKGFWRWRVYRPGGMIHGGSAESGAEAKAIAEGLQDDEL